MSIKDFLKNSIVNNVSPLLSVGSLISLGQMGCNILSYLDDGKIDAQEINELLAGSSGIESLLLAVLAYFLRRK